MKILIDNGHGAKTRGKRSPDGRPLEYLENRIIALGIVDALTARGLDASLLAPEETDISLPGRCRRDNDWCRQLGHQNIILISIHRNAAGRGENLFMDSPSDCAFLLSPEGQQSLVDLHVDGICDYKSQVLIWPQPILQLFNTSRS